MLVKVLLKIIGKMILADGKIRLEEVGFLADVQQGLGMDEGDIKTILVEAEKASLKELAANVTEYSDKLYIVQQAFYAALVDQDFHLTEMALFEDLVEAFHIDPADIQRIKRSAKAIEEHRYNVFTDKDLAFLHSNFLNSSFALGF